MYVYIETLAVKGWKQSKLVVIVDQMTTTKQVGPKDYKNVCLLSKKP